MLVLSLPLPMFALSSLLLQYSSTHSTVLAMRLPLWELMFALLLLLSIVAVAVVMVALGVALVGVAAAAAVAAVTAQRAALHRCAVRIAPGTKIRKPHHERNAHLNYVGKGPKGKGRGKR
jgi:hypothetical protein